MRPSLAAAALALAFAVPAAAADAPIPIVAAENFYGEVAARIGGARVAVESIALGPEADPHDFEPSASVARAVADARIVIMNGAEYDHWMERLVEASGGAERSVIDVAALIGKAAGDNPHVWYDPKAVPALAGAVTAALSEIDPASAADFASREKTFLASLQPLTEKIAALRERFAGAPVTATEPVFGPMAEALGLVMRNQDFQTAVMNETEPSATEIAAFEDDLRKRNVRVLFYNEQVVDPLTERLLAVAKEAGVPVVGVTESMPEGLDYAGWMMRQLEATEKALSDASS